MAVVRNPATGLWEYQVDSDVGHEDTSRFGECPKCHQPESHLHGPVSYRAPFGRIRMTLVCDACIEEIKRPRQPRYTGG